MYVMISSVSNPSVSFIYAGTQLPYVSLMHTLGVLALSSLLM